MLRMLKTINNKLILLIGMTTILIFTIFSYISINLQDKQFIAEVLRGARIFSDTVKRSTHYDMLMDDRQGIHRMIETIGGQPGIEVVRIFNKEGNIMFSTDKKEINHFVDKNAEACYICHAAQEPLERLSTLERSRIFQAKGHRVLAMITPIYNEPSCYSAACHVHSKGQRVLGVLDIGMSLADVDEDLQNNRLILIFFTLAAILSVSVILAIFIHRLVTKPVKQLADATKKVSGGFLDIEIQVRTGDEIGQLAAAFNHMVRDLKSAEQKIQSWNIELEKKVEERTQKLHQAREQLIQSEKMASMGVLASSVAHEINNPLQGILTYIKLMLKIISGEEIEKARLEEFRDYLQLMGDEIERCGDMVKNLLVFSRQSRMDIREADVNSIIQNSLKLLENKIKLQNINVVLNLQQDIPAVFCDVKQIQQTLIALLINAIEAMPEGGNIIVLTMYEDSKSVEIIIADTGVGIEKEKLKNIFDPFFTTKDAAKSTGLGLFVAYGIIKEHKGTIEVKSEPGEGAEFHIKLPVKKAG